LYLTAAVPILHKYNPVSRESERFGAQRLIDNRFQRGVYPAEDFTAVKKYGLTMLVSSDDQVKAYIKKIMSQLDKWMIGGKISKLVVVITSKDTGEHVERWQFDVSFLSQQLDFAWRDADARGAIGPDFQ
jgi:mitotic spindle assembly checkpoint protein MAD2